MKIIDIITRISNDEELPKEIYYNGDYGELTREGGMTNYFMYKKDSQFEFYWLIDHRLDNLNEEIEIKKEKEMIKNDTW